MEVMEDGPSVIAPHRGFNAKAREVLLDPPHPGGPTMPLKSNSDFDLRRRLRNSCSLIRRDSQGTSGSTPKSRSRSSTQSCNEKQPTFDGIGEVPNATRTKSLKHKFLGELGKTRSAGDVFRKSVTIFQANGHIVDKKLFRTFQQDNIMRLPSMDSDIESTGAYRSITGDDAVSPYPFEGPQRASRYEQDKSSNVKKWLEKQ